MTTATETKLTAEQEQRAQRWAVKCRRKGASPDWDGTQEQLPVWRRAYHIWEEMWDKHYARQRAAAPVHQRTMLDRVTELVCRRRGIKSPAYGDICEESSTGVYYHVHELGTGRYSNVCTRCWAKRQQVESDHAAREAGIEITKIMARLLRKAA